jgi:hypothetical protein
VKRDKKQQPEKLDSSGSDEKIDDHYVDDVWIGFRNEEITFHSFSSRPYKGLWFAWRLNHEHRGDLLE